MNRINKQEEYISPLAEIMEVSETSVLCASQTMAVENLIEDDEFVW